MVALVDLKQYSKGGDLSFDLFLTNDDGVDGAIGTPLSDAATQTISLVIADKFTKDTLAEFNTTPQITLVDAPTAKFKVILNRTDLAALKSEVDYRYNIWSTSAGNNRLPQVIGTFRLLDADSPA